MSSPAVAALLRKDEKSASPVDSPPQQQGATNNGIFSQHYWANFLQVQIDKFCLLGLFVFLLKVCVAIGFGSDAGKIIFALANNILGAYIYSIQARRFKT